MSMMLVCKVIPMPMSMPMLRRISESSYPVVSLRSNLHIPSKPLHHLLPVGQVLAGFGRSNVPRARSTHKLYGNFTYHLQSHIELFRLLNGATQVIFGVYEERGGGDATRVAQWRTVPVVNRAFLVPGITFCL